MIVEDHTPFGSPTLPEGRRDRICVWIAEHRWAVPVIRLADGFAVLAALVLVFGIHLSWAKILAFVVCVAVGETAGRHERERGDTILEALLTRNDFPTPPDELPSEFDEYFRQPPYPRCDDRYFRPRA